MCVSVSDSVPLVSRSLPSMLRPLSLFCSVFYNSRLQWRGELLRPHFFALTHLISFQCLGSCKSCCPENKGACVISNSHFLWIYPRSGRVGFTSHMVPLSLVLSFFFFKETHASTHTSYTHLHPNKEKRRIPFSLSPLQDFLLIDLFDAGHSEPREVIPRGGFAWLCFWCLL